MFPFTMLEHITCSRAFILSFGCLFHFFFVCRYQLIIMGKKERNHCEIILKAPQIVKSTMFMQKMKISLKKGVQENLAQPN